VHTFNLLMDTQLYVHTYYTVSWVCI
jgi:hypothetical protein